VVNAQRTTLAGLIAESPHGLAVDRVLRWADQLAAALDDLHARGRCHGSVNPASVFIDEHDEARLGVGTGPDRDPTERDLLLGDAGAAKTTEPARARPEDDVRGLAATLYEALGGNPEAIVAAAPPPLPISGVSIQMNMTLLEALSPRGRRRGVRAGDLVRTLQGGPATPGPARPAERMWTNRIAVTLMAVAALVCVIAGTRLWFGPGSPQRPRDQPAVSNSDVAAADRDIREALAARASRQREGVVPGRPELTTDPRQDARAHAERAADLWWEALAGAPASWLGDDTVQTSCTEAMVAAEDAQAAARAGRFEQSRRDYEHAVLMLAEATALHDQGVARMLAEAASAREDGRLTGALNLLDEAEPFARPEDIDAERVQTYVAMAWVPPEPAPARETASPLALDPEPPVKTDAPDDQAHRTPLSPRVRVNSLSQTLILVQPGEFVMGSPKAEPLRNEAEGQHPVHIPEAFWMTRVEVTRGQFAAFVAETRYVTDAERARWSHGLGDDGRWRQVDGITWREPGFAQSDSHPVVCVSLHDALAFCRWLSDQEGRAYRLPTEAEWEYACRAGSLTAYAWGDDVFDELPRANAADKSWTDKFPDAIGFRWQDDCVFTSPVGRFSANAWGLFDMHGNVTEWCLDRFVPYGTDPVENVVDPEALSSGNPAPRVMRGGSFAATPAHSRAAHRDASPPDSSFVTVGFRVVMEQNP
jgi:formylglycine-generating enzyme required for sulfatase activity